MAGGSIQTVAFNLAAVAIGTVSGVALARVLGPVGRGELVAIQTWPGLIAVFGPLGLPAAAAYFSGREPADAGRLMTTATVALLSLSLPFCVAAYFMMPWLLRLHSGQVVDYGRNYLLLIPVQFAIAVPFAVLQALGHLRLWNILRTLGPVVWLLVIAAAYVLRAPSVRFITSVYPAAMAAVGVGFFYVAIRVIRPPFRATLARLPELMRFGIPCTLAAVPQVLNLRLDQLIMAAVMPAKVLGLYVVAVAWSAAPVPILAAISQVLVPRLLAAQTREAQAEVIERSLRFGVLVAVLLVLPTILVTPVAVPLLFGSGFTAAVPAAQVLVVAGCISQLNMIVEESLRNIGKPRWPMVAEFFGLIATAGLLALLLPRYQIMGAAVASLLAYALTLLVLLRLVARETGVSISRCLVPTAADVELLRRQLEPYLLRLTRLGRQKPLG